MVEVGSDEQAATVVVGGGDDDRKAGGIAVSNKDSGVVSDGSAAAAAVVVLVVEVGSSAIGVWERNAADSVVLTLEAATELSGWGTCDPVVSAISVGTTGETETELAAATAKSTSPVPQCCDPVPRGENGAAAVSVAQGLGAKRLSKELLAAALAEETGAPLS